MENEMVFKPQTFHGRETDISASQSNLASLLETKVATALARAADIDATEIAVTSVGSTIVLSGVVAYPEEIEIAGDIASRVVGITLIENRISLASSNDNLRVE
jgi:osmotically-inducible protein OsmY